MESKLAPALTQLNVPLSVNSHSFPFLPHLCRRSFPASQFQLSQLQRGSFLYFSAPSVNQLSSFPLFKRFISVELPPTRSGFASVSIFGGNVGYRRGAVGGSGESADAITGRADDISVLPSDVIILDVRGMTCGGCAASVKRILENQAEVSSASVDFMTDTAVVWPSSEAKVEPNWQKQLGEALAKQVTSCGFESNLRG